MPSCHGITLAVDGMMPSCTGITLAVDGMMPSCPGITLAVEDMMPSCPGITRQHYTIAFHSLHVYILSFHFVTFNVPKL